MKQVAITGATGPLGMALVKYISGQGINVTAIVRPGSEKNVDILVSDKIRVVECDLTNLLSLKGKLPHHFDAFFHFGWNTETKEVVKDPLIQSRNIIPTLDAVQLAYDLGCKVFVGAGSQSECGAYKGKLRPDTPENPLTGYAIAKYAAGKLSRQLCESLGMRHCWCRILSMYGPFDRDTTSIMYCIYSLLKKKRPNFTRSLQKWDFIYSADCARAVYLIAKKGRHGVSYPIGFGTARPLKEYFRIIRDNIDPKLELGFGKIKYTAGQRMYLCSDNRALKKDTGFIPRYTFEEGIKETIRWAKTRLREIE